MTKVKRLHPEAVLPVYGYPGDAGMDLCVVGDHVLAPGESRDLPTGIAVEMEDQLWGRITGRSSTLRKRGLFVNEGVIDNGYRGELLIYVTNRQSTPVQIDSGDRLAQLILTEIHNAPAAWADELSPSDRGTNGFGSTGHRTIEVPGAGGVTDLQADQRRTTTAAFDPLLTQVHPVGPVYLGGAVDIGTFDTHAWRHDYDWGVPVYCPVCECDGLESPEEIINRNTRALDMASDALFVLDAFSVGTPIEAWHRIMRRGKSGVIVWPHADPSVFVTAMSNKPGVTVVPDIKAARAAIESRALAREVSR